MTWSMSLLPRRAPHKGVEQLLSFAGPNQHPTTKKTTGPCARTSRGRRPACIHNERNSTPSFQQRLHADKCSTLLLQRRRPPPPPPPPPQQQQQQQQQPQQQQQEQQEQEQQQQQRQQQEQQQQQLLRFNQTLRTVSSLGKTTSTRHFLSRNYGLTIAGCKQHS